MIYLLLFVLVIFILFLIRELRLRSSRLNSLQKEHTALRETLDSLTVSASETSRLTEPLLQSANTIHLYAALLSEDTLSPLQKELPEGILQEGEQMLDVLKTSLF